MTHGNGPHMAEIIAAATTAVPPPRPLGPGDTLGEPAEIEPHLPNAMSDRIVIRHDERNPRR